jgi:hypothetical protein
MDALTSLSPSVFADAALPARLGSCAIVVGRDMVTGELYRFGLTPIEGNGFE